MSGQQRVTIYDLAAKLGVSVATVNRAFSDSGRISPETRLRVLETAEEMGYRANRAAQSLRRGPLRIGVLLCCPVAVYLNEIRRGVESAFSDLAQYNVYPDLHTVAGYNAEDRREEINAVLDGFVSDGCAGAVLFLSGDNSGFAGKVAELSAAMPVATVANDLPPCGQKVSVTADGERAGRLAAELLGLCCPVRRFAVVTGGLHTAIHAANVRGFRGYADEHGFRRVDLYEHDDDRERFVEQMERVIARRNDYDGIYITSSSSTLGERLLSGAAGLRVVTTDLYAENRALLKKELICATIFQNPRRQGYTVVQRLYRYLSERTGTGRVLITPELVFSSNADTRRGEEFNPFSSETDAP